jgi:hypothetical protein
MCYELMSEPIVSAPGGYYHGDMQGWWFQQSIVPTPPADPDRTARAWTSMMVNAVRSQDDRPVTIGLLPSTSGPFSPGNLGGLLDLLSIHEYPATGQAPAAAAMVRAFAATGKPVALGETFILNDDAATQRAFLTSVAPDLAGTFEFFDGRDPSRMTVRSIYDGTYRQSLAQFRSLRGVLIGRAPLHVR